MTSWDSEFKRLDSLILSELKKTQSRLDATLMEFKNGHDFLPLLKEFIDSSVQLNQIYGVIKYTQRWKTNGTKSDAGNTAEDRREDPGSNERSQD